MALQLLSGCTSPPARSAGPPITALITIDTWRADHFSATHTPNLWALAQQGLRFDNAWSPIGLTSAAHATMLSGLPPWQHGLRANNHHGYSLLPEVPLIQEQLGLPAAAFVSAFPAGPEGGLGRGFSVFDGPDSGERPGGVAVERALAWIATQDGPAFLWVHLFEPHGPYQGTGATEAERYAEEVRLADHLLAPLLEALVVRGSRIVVASDHGEVLGEEPCGLQHDRSVHDAVLAVPLFTWSPELSAGVVSDLVGLSDVPTLLRGQTPAGRSVWLAEAGMCEPSCSPGCAPPGLSGRDRVAIEADGRWYARPGAAIRSVGRPSSAARALLEAIEPVPLPQGATPEEAAVLGYVLPDEPAEGSTPRPSLPRDP